jgi:hypothetical protein
LVPGPKTLRRYKRWKPLYAETLRRIDGAILETFCLLEAVLVLSTAFASADTVTLVSNSGTGSARSLFRRIRA